MKIGYIINKKLWEEENERGRNYWWIYIEEILNRIGITAEAIDIENLEKNIEEFKFLFLGPDNYEKIREIIKKWVKNGGVIFGFNCWNIDNVFGNKFEKYIIEKSPFEINGYLNFTQNIFTKDFFKKFPVFSNLRCVIPVNSKTIAYFKNYPVITLRKYHKGYAIYFGFDISKTIWLINQGRPVDNDYDKDGYLRNGDGIVLKSNKIPITDKFLIFLENIINYIYPIPFIYHLPPLNEKDIIPDAVFFYSGDDESTKGVHFPSAEFMRNLGLPYHINIMPDKNFEFAISNEEFEKLEKNNIEISLHYNFMDNFNHPCGFSEEDVNKQTEIFINRFKKVPICVNTHWLRWTGWYEPALWMGKFGIKGFNGKIHSSFPPINPINKIGFAFGTSLPFFYWTDYKYGNKKIEFIDLPITFYECGYIGEKPDFKKIEKAISIAVKYNSISNFFYHPIYITNFPSCRKAIEKIIEITKRKNLKILHTTPDKITKFWIGRSKSKISNLKRREDFISFDIFCENREGLVVKFYTGNKKIVDLNFPFKISRNKSIFIKLPYGESRVEIKF